MFFLLYRIAIFDIAIYRYVVAALVHRLYFLTNLLLNQKCSLVYQHKQLLLVQAMSTLQLAKAYPTMSYILLVTTSIATFVCDQQ